MDIFELVELFPYDEDAETEGYLHIEGTNDMFRSIATFDTLMAASIILGALKASSINFEVYELFIWENIK